MQLKHFIEHHKDLEEGKYARVTSWEGKDAAKLKNFQAIKDRSLGICLIQNACFLSSNFIIYP